MRMGLARVLLSVLLVLMACTLSCNAAGRNPYAKEQFPNPKTQYAACGQKKASSICDPGRYITPVNATKINDFILTLRQTFTCLCDKCDECLRLGRRTSVIKHEIMVAIVPRVKFSNGKYPASTTEQVLAVAQFAEYLLSTKWKPTKKDCTLGAVIIHDAYTQMTYTALNKYASKVLTAIRLFTASADASVYFARRDISAGVGVLLTKYKGYLNDGKPSKEDSFEIPSPDLECWQIVLIVLGILLVIGIIVFFVYRYLCKD